MKRNGRARSGAEAKRRRARIARKVRVRGLVKLVHEVADMRAALSREGYGPFPPYLPFNDREPAVARAWLSRGGALHWKTWPRRRISFEPAGLDGTAFFDVDHPLSEGDTFSNVLAQQAFVHKRGPS